MTLVFGADDLVAQYVAHNLGVVIAGPYSAIGATEDGQTLCAGCVFNRWNGFDIEFHLYGPGCMTRSNLRGIFRHAFVAIGAIRVTAVTKRSNRNMQKLLPRLGFQFEGVQKRYFGQNKQDDGMRFVLFFEHAAKWMR